jgi:hypothetical protein
MPPDEKFSLRLRRYNSSLKKCSSRDFESFHQKQLIFVIIKPSEGEKVSEREK